MVKETVSGLLTLPGHESGLKYKTGCVCRGCRAARCLADAKRKTRKKSVGTGVFYIVKNPDTEYIKFGITMRSARYRLENHRKDGYTIKVKIYRYLPGTIARDLERLVIAELKLRRIKPVKGHEYYNSIALPYVIALADKWLSHESITAITTQIPAATPMFAKVDAVKSASEISNELTTYSGPAMTLKQLCDAGVVPIRYSTATRARTRAGQDFPDSRKTPSGIVYRPADVQSWFANRSRN